MLRNTVRIVLSLVVSAVFLWVAFRNVDLEAAWQQLLAVDGIYLIGFILSVAIIQLVRIYRWDLLIRPFARLSPAATFRVSSLGMMFILVLPLRLGELARPYLVKQETGAPISSSLGAAAVERTVDGLLVTLLFFVTTFALPSTYEVPAGIKAGGIGSLVLFASATVVIVAGLIAKDWVMSLLRRIGTPISPTLTDKALTLLDAFIEGCRSLPDVRTVLAVLVCTLIYWLANGLGYYLIMIGFGWDLPLVAPFFLISILVIAIMIPAAPGFLGTFQGAILAGLTVFGFDATASAAYGMVVYPLTVLVVLAFGLPYVFLGGTKVGAIINAPTEELAPTSAES